MSIFLRVCLFLASMLTCGYIARKLKKSQMQVVDTVYWIGMAVVFVGLSVFPEAADYISNLLGFYATVNFIFLLVIFILLIRCFLLSIKVSQLDDKLKNLTEEIAIWRNEIENKK